MPILAIETSNPTAMRPDAAIAALGSTADPRNAAVTTAPATELPAAIHQLLRDRNTNPTDVDAIAVSVGPGGYTAIRTAVALTASFALAANVPAIPVPTANAVAAAVDHASTPLIVALAWKRESAHVTRFEPGLLVPTDHRIRPLEQLAPTEPHILAADQRLLDTLHTDRQLPSNATTVPLALDARHVLAASKHLAPVEPAALTPLYPREPEAVTKWRERHQPTSQAPGTTGKTP